MHSTVRDQIVALLQTAPGNSLALRELHRRLANVTGVAAPSILHLEDQLRRDSAFTLSRSASPVRLFRDLVEPHVLERYETAMRNAGIECDTRVALRDEVESTIHWPADWTTATLERSIAALRGTTRNDAVLRERIVEGEAEIDALRPLLHSATDPA